MRRGYIDWLRGISVVIMIEAHTLDAWTRLDARHNATYARAMIVGGFAAPGFLFLAGIALALAAGSRLRRGRSEAEAAALARRRALQIFGLAFLFRLQSWLISGGDPVQALLKVDILNVMGLSMLAAALVWSLGRGRWDRVAWMLVATTLVAMVTPLVRAAPWLSPLPDPIEWYLRPIPGRGTFTLFPWGGFLLAGVAVGVWLDAARTADAERRLNVMLAATGIALTFAYAWNALWPGRSVLQEFGRASLFVYWIHVELAYGVLTGPLHKSLTLGRAFTAYALFTVALFGAAKVKDQVVDWWNTGRLQPSGAL
jgi:uncharacterized membrane protein